ISGSSTSPAQASFTPTSGNSFGFKVDSRYSDDTLNPLDFNPSTGQTYANTGHAFRFYPLKDNSGNRIDNTYIMAMDYTGLSYSNYDYQDNIYLLSNIRPASTSSAGASAGAAPSTATSPGDIFSKTAVQNEDALLLGESGEAVV